MAQFQRRIRRAWARDANRPAQCSCQPVAVDAGDAVLLEHRPHCQLSALAEPGALILSVRGPGYGEPGYGKAA